jgi:hypothetical protein
MVGSQTWCSGSSQGKSQGDPKAKPALSQALVEGGMGQERLELEKDQSGRRAEESAGQSRSPPQRGETPPQPSKVDFK